jgi:hypothetical protein
MQTVARYTSLFSDALGFPPCNDTVEYLQGLDNPESIEKIFINYVNSLVELRDNPKIENTVVKNIGELVRSIPFIGQDAAEKIMSDRGAGPQEFMIRGCTSTSAHPFAITFMQFNGSMSKLQCTREEATTLSMFCKVELTKWLYRDSDSEWKIEDIDHHLEIDSKKRKRKVTEINLKKLC